MKLPATACIPSFAGSYVFNRMMDVLLNQSFVPKTGLLRSAIFKASSIYLSATVQKDKKPGESLQFLPEATLPENLRWAESHPFISRAFACMAAAANSSGESVLEEKVRDTLIRFLDTWDGKDTGMSRKWADNHVEFLNGPSRIAEKLALITAIAPYQVDEELVQAFRSTYPEDVQLLHVLSWSSFTAACRIGEWCLPSIHKKRSE